MPPRVQGQAYRRDKAAAVNFQSLRRTFATWMQKTGATVKDVQAAMRHSTPDHPIRTYVKEIPESVRMAVQNLDAMLTLTTQGRVHCSILQRQRPGARSMTPTFGAVRSVTATSVALSLTELATRSYQLTTLYDRLRKAGMLAVEEMAQVLGIASRQDLEQAWVGSRLRLKWQERLPLRAPPREWAAESPRRQTIETGCCQPGRYAMCGGAAV